MLGRLLLILISVPVVETLIFIDVGARIGLYPTALIIVLTALLGIWMVKTQGLRTLNTFNRAVHKGLSPERAIANGMLLFLAGPLLILPGLLTDTCGLLLLLPITRNTICRRFARSISNKSAHFTATTHIHSFPSQPQPADDKVIEAEIIERPPTTKKADPPQSDKPT